MTEIQSKRSIESGLLNGKPVWTIEQPVATHDGKIFFYDENLQCYFDIKIHQTKGEGAHYYKNAEKPDNDHIEIMKMMQFLKPQNKTWTTQELYQQLVQCRIDFGPDKEVAIKPFSGRMSELFKKDVIIKDKGDTYKINHEYIEIILKTGKYETNKKKVPRPLDPDALYQKMLKHYIDDKGYDKDQANKIAKSVVNQQLSKHGQKPVFETLN